MLFYIHRLDPFFNESMNTLTMQKDGPETESDQTLYNMLIATYGTHYVTYAVLGATAHIFTLLNDIYTKSSSFQEITVQVTRASNFFFFSTYSVDYTHNIQQNLTELFRKNSQYFAEYQPPVPKIPNKTEWQ